MSPSPAAIILTAATGPERPAALEALVPPGWTSTVVRPGVGSVLDGTALVVADAVALSPELLAAADRGATVVVLEPASGEVEGEWFVALTDAARPWAARLPAEWPVVGAFRPLASTADDEVLAVVSIGFADRPAITRRTHGTGAIVTCALAGRHSLTPELAGLLARLGRGRPLAAGTLGVGILGYGPLGAMGLHHGLGVTRIEGLELVAVCDASPGRLKAAEQEFPGVSAWATPAELGADAGVDVAIVATPPSTHPELAEAMLRAGKHVVCEKPLCFTPAQADRLIAVAAAEGRVLTVHQNRRWDADFLAVRAVVESGRLGQVFNTETFVGGFEHPCRAWHSEVSISGGAIYDWGAHYLDWTLLLMGTDPVRVTASGHKRVWRDVTNEDQVRVRLEWADGREAEFVHSDVAAVRRPKFYLQGTRGTLVGHYRPVTFESIEPGLGYRAHAAHHAEAPAALTLATYESRLGLREEQVPLPAVPDFAFHANLADHLLLGEPLAVPPESVRDVIAVLDAAKRSLAAGGEPTTPTTPTGQA